MRIHRSLPCSPVIPPANANRETTHLNAIGFLLALGRADGPRTTVIARTDLLDRLPGAGAFEAFLRYSKLAGELPRFGRTHDGRSAAPWGWDDLE